MHTTFIINGGAGRVIAAIPALEKYAAKNPHDDFIVLVHGWENLYWSHPLLQNRTFSIGQKGIFDHLVKNNRCVSPEPYLLHGYYNQQLHLCEAFDQEINVTGDHKDLMPPRLYTSTWEKSSAAKIIAEKKSELGRNKCVVFQPYGSGTQLVNNRPYDNTQRSMDVDDYQKLIADLYEKNSDVFVIFFGPKELKHPGDAHTVYLDNLNGDLRMYLSLIEQCDLFVGCDSVGQHMARAVNKPGVVIMGSTFEKNVTYQDHFTIFRPTDRLPTYSPIRIAGWDTEFADRSNDGIMRFDETALKKFTALISRQLYEL